MLLKAYAILLTVRLHQGKPSIGQLNALGIVKSLAK